MTEIVLPPEVTSISDYAFYNCDNLQSNHYPDAAMMFSWDDGATGDYYTALGGRGTYPYTLVLDENGIITEIFVSSVHYEDLKTAVENAK